MPRRKEQAESFHDGRGSCRRGPAGIRPRSCATSCIEKRPSREGKRRDYAIRHSDGGNRPGSLEHARGGQLMAVAACGKWPTRKAAMNCRTPNGGRASPGVWRFVAPFPGTSSADHETMAEDIARSTASAPLNSRHACSHDSVAPWQFQPSVQGPPQIQRSVYLGAALLPAQS